MPSAEWGYELWDGYEAVAGHIRSQAEKMVDVYARYLKEKAELEREYAKGLRKIVSRYEPVKKRKHQDKVEPTETSSFRALLKETGYQAGQHEVLAEHLAKLLVKEVQKKAAEILKKTKDNSKQAKKYQDMMDASYFTLEKSKLKYEKGFHDWREAERNFQVADQDGTISRNEILKMKVTTETKCQAYEKYRQEYKEQLAKTNKDQSEYFSNTLPGVVNMLQDIDKDRINFIQGVLERALIAEREAVKISNKCRDSMEEAIKNINEDIDQDEVIERYKTGDLSPNDIEFEEMEISRKKKSSSLTRRLSRTSFTQKKGKQNLFQEKRNILKNIDKHKNEIARGTKEIQALQLMIQTYKDTPDFGDSKKFQEELTSVTLKVESLTQNLSSLSRELDLVESKMNLNMRHSLLAAPSSSRGSLNNSILSAESDSTGYGSQDSNPGTESREFDEDSTNCISRCKIESVNPSDNTVNDSLFKSNDLSIGDEKTKLHMKSDSCEISEISKSSSEVWGDDFEEESVDLSPRFLIALYSYDGSEEGTLAMEEGEEFEISGEDVDGWIKVKRKDDFSEEGYIPTAFTERVGIVI